MPGQRDGFRFERADEEVAEVTRRRASIGAAQRPASPPPSPFLPVTVRLLQRGPTEPPPIEADLPNGVRLRIPTADPCLACRIIRTVAAAKTNSGGTR